MNFVSARVTRRLVTVPAYGFGNPVINWNTTENPIKDRVMSTSTWPAPYYQRKLRAYPVRCKKETMSLLGQDSQIDDSNWWFAKHMLQKTAKGRQIVEHTENHLQTDSFLLIKSDSAGMAKAYVEDIVQFLDVANKENKRILSTTDLL